jgi:hypothetical protein
MSPLGCCPNPWSTRSPGGRNLSASLPASYRIAVGGTSREPEITGFRVRGRALMLFVMISFLMIQLRSFNRLLLVLSVSRWA